MAPVGFNCGVLSQIEQDKANSCYDEKGYPEYTYDSNGCQSKFKECNYCQKDFDTSNQRYNLYFFIISSILALVAIGIGLSLPSSDGLNEWIATGFMLGDCLHCSSALSGIISTLEGL